MYKNLALLTAFLACFVIMVAPSQGGVVSALSGENTVDDVLTDDSLGFIVDADSSGTINSGDVSFGIAWIDDVNGDPTVAGRTYIVYSVQFDTLDPGFGVWTYKPTTVNAYKLDTLLNKDINDNSIAAVVERKTAPVPSDVFYPKNEPGYRFGAGEFPGTDPSGMINDIQTLMSNADFIFAAGINSAQGDFLATTPVTSTMVSVSAQLSITDAGGLNINDFKPLFTLPGFEAAIFSAQQNVEFANFPSGVGYIRTFDSGNYKVNYVPEPTSLAGLIGLGLTGVGLARIRRRRA